MGRARRTTPCDDTDSGAPSSPAELVSWGRGPGPCIFTAAPPTLNRIKDGTHGTGGRWGLGRRGVSWLSEHKGPLDLRRVSGGFGRV